MSQQKRIRLGDLLVQNELITNDQLMEALAEQRKSGRKLGATLIEMQLVSEAQLLQLLSEHLKVRLIDIDQHRVDPNAVRLLPEIQARRYRALVLEDNVDHLLVAMSDPADLAAIDNLNELLAKPVKVAVVSEAQLFGAYDNFYRKTEEIASFAQELAEEYETEDEFGLTGELNEGSDTAVAKLLQSIFEDAIKAKASDIHIEPDENQLRIRQRVDGVLQETVIKEKNIAAALVLRLKLMAGMDISEKRLPQDGRTHIRVKGHRVDVRLSTMPIQAGESVVMRLFDQSAGMLTLDQTGMPNTILARFRTLLKRPYGMVLVTGPTGSGKTTTLYGALSELNQAAKKIITVEEPVEYRLPRINQVQVNNKINLSFSSILRTTLRQDPDIIMVGEMRDHETVEIGLRGALTGHLVLSTLHTNDAISSAIRLLDMGAPGYLVATSLRAIVAQRLVRRVCDNCTVDYQPDEDELFWLNHIDESAGDITFKRGMGCQKCNQTGYRGRVGVFELLEMNEQMMTALKTNDTELFSQAARESKGYRPLAHTALTYAKMGVTTVEEVLKLVEIVAERDVDYQLDETSHLGQLQTPQDVKGQSLDSSPKPQKGLDGGLSLEDIPDG